MAVVTSGSGCFQRITNSKSFKRLYFKNFTIGELTKHILGKFIPVFFKEQKILQLLTSRVSNRKQKPNSQLLFIASQHNEH